MLKIKYLQLITLILTSVYSYSQHIIQTVAFYNLENLFDTVNDPEKLDELSPMMELKSNREFVYQDKLSKLASVLSEIGHHKNKLPPAVIGVVEVENLKVLEDLIATPPLSTYNYGIVHFDSPDKRGIDTALLYLKKCYTPIFNEVFPANLYKDNLRIDTRDILHSTGYLLNDKVHILVNHWPSRRGGVKKTTKLRQSIAKTLLMNIETIYTEDPDAKIIIMGDFNDNPTNKSIKKILNAKASKKKLQPKDLYNPFEKMYKKGHNTLVYRSELFLFDQILFNRSFLSKNQHYSGFWFYKAGIHNPSYMTVSSGKYKGHPKRSFGGGKYLGGYSDHYPVYSYLLKENK